MNDFSDLADQLKEFDPSFYYGSVLPPFEITPLSTVGSETEEDAAPHPITRP